MNVHANLSARLDVSGEIQVEFTCCAVLQEPPTPHWPMIFEDKTKCINQQDQTTGGGPSTGATTEAACVADAIAAGYSFVQIKGTPDAVGYCLPLESCSRPLAATNNWRVLGDPNVAYEPAEPRYHQYLQSAKERVISGRRSLVNDSSSWYANTEEEDTASGALAGARLQSCFSLRW